MQPEVEGCCQKPPMWIFVYQNNDVYSICKDHFYSTAHRCDVKNAINFQTRINYDPQLVFEEYPILSPQEKPEIV
jgi:FPC/CPF motif-containing protein YcgG